VVALTADFGRVCAEEAALQKELSGRRGEKSKSDGPAFDTLWATAIEIGDERLLAALHSGNMNPADREELEHVLSTEVVLKCWNLKEQRDFL
jgi:hypothetical protein